MDARFYSFNKARNSTKLPSGSGERFEILLKEPESVTRPEITIAYGFSEFQYNYCYIPLFRRYYYIVSIVHVNSKMIRVNLEVDVLATYRTEILNTSAFVQYAQSAYNTMIADSRLPISDACENVYYENAFPPYNSEGSFIINFASKDANGNTGMAASIVSSAGGIRALAAQLFNKSKLKNMLEYYNDPLDMVISCIWLPIGATFCSDGTTSATLGDSDISFVGPKTRKEYGSALILDYDLPYKTQLPSGAYTYADYRNVEPYTQYLCTLPGVGTVEIPMSSYIEDGAVKPEIRINYVLSPINGDINYEFVAGDAVIMTCDGNIGIPVPLANTSYNTSAAVQSYLTGIAGAGAAVVSFFTGNILGAAAGMGANIIGTLGTFTKARQAHNHVSGNLGGFSGERFCEKIKVTVRPYTISDSPSNIGATIGRPLFANRRLGSLSGFVKCTGAYVKCTATAEEFDMLNVLLNNFATNAYGGVIIE